MIFLCIDRSNSTAKRITRLIQLTQKAARLISSVRPPLTRCYLQVGNRMSEISVVHIGKLSPEDRACVQDLFADVDYRVDENPDHVPRFAYAGGPGAEVPLAWLVITFVGTGAAFFLKSFVESLGSEAAKKLISRFGRKHKPELGEPEHPIVLVAELRPHVAAIIPLRTADDLVPEALGELATNLEAVADTLPVAGQHLLYAWKGPAGGLDYVVDTDDEIRPLVWDSQRGIFVYYQ